MKWIQVTLVYVLMIKLSSGSTSCGFSGQGCGTGCIDCTSPSQCDIYKPGYWLQGGYCFTSCNPAIYMSSTQSCYNCPTNGVPNADFTDCSCRTNFISSGSVANQDLSCDCPANYFINVVTQSSCDPCQDGSTSSAIKTNTYSTNCECKENYKSNLQGGIYLICECPSNFYITGTGSDQTCSACPTGSVSENAGSSTCTCKANFVSNGGSGAGLTCTCPDNYFVMLGQCSPCYPNTYSKSGDASCSSTPPQGNSTMTATTSTSKVSAGQIIGIVIGILAFLGILAYIIILLIKKRKQHKKKSAGKMDFENIPTSPPIQTEEIQIE